jgi:NitT/TauT family transport system ATP-binding protein
MPEALIDVRHLSKTYEGGSGTGTEAIDDLTFCQREGEFLVLVGPSGCGKTTMLRCLSALLPVTTGEVRFDGEPVTSVPESLAVVFQDYTRSLYPWLTVRRNVGFALDRVPKAERAGRIDEALAHVGLGDFGDHYPWQLSGGMQQRAAIARAVAARPRILLMDEPFASVDAQTRTTLESMVLDLWQEYGWTVLLVTHDIDEAVFLADRVLVLSQRPSRILEEVTIDLPRPRDQIETRALPEFQEYRKHVMRLIYSQH